MKNEFYQTPKPQVVGSNPTAPGHEKRFTRECEPFFMSLEAVRSEPTKWVPNSTKLSFPTCPVAVRSEATTCGAGHRARLRDLVQHPTAPVI